MNAGWWGLLILIFVIPFMVAGVTLTYLGIADLRRKDHSGWFAIFVGWIAFWWSALYGAAFIYDNLT